MGKQIAELREELQRVTDKKRLEDEKRAGAEAEFSAARQERTLLRKKVTTLNSLIQRMAEESVQKSGQISQLLKSVDEHKLVMFGHEYRGLAIPLR